MRLALTLLLLLLAAPAAAPAQERADAAHPPREGAPLVPRQVPLLPPPVLVPADEAAERLAPAAAPRDAAARAGRAEDFLWQVLLTAASTLVAALIWRALD